jgi:hypothetical protein
MNTHTHIHTQFCLSFDNNWNVRTEYLQHVCPRFLSIFCLKIRKNTHPYICWINIEMNVGNVSQKYVLDSSALSVKNSSNCCYKTLLMQVMLLQNEILVSEFVKWHIEALKINKNERRYRKVPPLNNFAWRTTEEGPLKFNSKLCGQISFYFILT